MIYLRKLFKIPGPADIGMSDSNNAMGSELFPQEGVNTWESYYRKMKQEYPVRFYFASTVPAFFVNVCRKVSKPIADAVYWIKCHVLKSHRYHMLDLRQTHHCERNHPDKCYHYGWVDVSDKMLFAMFNLLGEYLNKESPTDLTQWYSSVQIEADEGMKAQQAALQEARAIHYWWTVERDSQIDVRNFYLNRWSEARRNKDPDKDRYWNLLRELDEKLESKDDEMIARLMKIRRTLWT